MTQIIVYPRRFTSRNHREGSEVSGVVLSKGDITVQTLYELSENRLANTQSWNYRASVLDSALRLFGDFATWLNDQRRNPNLVGYNQEFLNDTMNFIHGGDRIMAVIGWMDLLADAGNLGRVIPVSALNPSRLVLGKGESTVEVLQQWLARPYGMEDLVQTLYLFFGQARRTAG